MEDLLGEENSPGVARLNFEKGNREVVIKLGQPNFFLHQGKGTTNQPKNKAGGDNYCAYGHELGTLWVFIAINSIAILMTLVLLTVSCFKPYIRCYPRAKCNSTAAIILSWFGWGKPFIEPLKKCICIYIERDRDRDLYTCSFGVFFVSVLYKLLCFLRYLFC